MPASQPANQPALEAAAPAPVRRLRRAERREQILAAATRAFARAGFAATSLDDIAAREPEFRAEMDRFHTAMVTIAQRELAARIPDPTWATWAARLTPVVAVEAVMAWLDAGQPDREQAAQRIGQALDGIIQAAQPPTG